MRSSQAKTTDGTKSRLELIDSEGATVRGFEVPRGAQLELVASAARPRAWIQVAGGMRSGQEPVDDPVKLLAAFTYDDIEKAGALAIDGVGTLAPVGHSKQLSRDISFGQEKSWAFGGSIGLVLSAAAVFLTVALTRPRDNPKIEEQLKARVVQIVKRIQVKPMNRPTVANVATTQTNPQSVPRTSKTAAIKRLGALAVLGSLKNGTNKGGLNLGAAQTTAGPGLGGNAGSGGVQSSLYGKGLVSAPLGAGGNMDGGGGYGTKGKGGGQAGYGKLSLVGSAGTMPIPMGREAIVGGGLDRDLIADVINRNLGQVRFCYEQGLQADPALAGRVAVDFTINGSGTVTVASVGSTTLGSKQVEDCILMRLKTWKFPLPEGGTDVKVSYPFVLRRSGQG